MARLKFRNGLNHTDYKCYTLEDAIAVCNANNWEIEAAIVTKKKKIKFKKFKKTT